MIVSGIYKITSPSNKIYIGSSVNIYDRWRDYKALDCKHQRRLYNSFIKYGVENHNFEIIEETTIEKLYEIETYYGILYDVLNKGLNCKLPKIGDIKISISDETRELIRIFRIGKKHTQETKDKISKSKKGQIPPNKGCKMSDETKLKISIANKGQIACNSKKVILTIDDKLYEFKSIKDASNFLQIPQTSFRRYLKDNKDIISIIGKIKIINYD